MAGLLWDAASGRAWESSEAGTPHADGRAGALLVAAATTLPAAGGVLHDAQSTETPGCQSTKLDFVPDQDAVSALAVVQFVAQMAAQVVLTRPAPRDSWHTRLEKAWLQRAA